MGKKIHITEAQLEGIMNKLNEDNAPINVDATSDVAAANGNASIGMKNAKNRLNQQGLNGKDVTLTTDADAVLESCGKPITKRQIKERKLKHLKENSICYNKKDLASKLNR